MQTEEVLEVMMLFAVSESQMNYCTCVIMKSYITAVNSKVSAGAVTIKESASRLEKRISVKAGVLNSKIQKSSRRETEVHIQDLM